MSMYPSVCGGYGIPGPAGPPGSVLDAWRGVWQEFGTYSPGDLVHHQGSVYLLVQPSNIPPEFYAFYPEPPEAPWELFVAGVDTGPGS